MIIGIQAIVRWYKDFQWYPIFSPLFT